MRNLLFVAATVALVAACQPASAPSSDTTSAIATATSGATRDISSDVSPGAPYITAAIADTHRPAADRAQDATRHSAETLALSGVAPGQKIGELLPGEGYFTRLFSNAVGAQGRVYAISRSAHDQYEHVVLEGTPNVSNIIRSSLAMRPKNKVPKPTRPEKPATQFGSSNACAIAQSQNAEYMGCRTLR